MAGLLTPDLNRGRLDVYQAVSAWVNGSGSTSGSRLLFLALLVVAAMSNHRFQRSRRLPSPWGRWISRIKRLEEQLPPSAIRHLCLYQLLDLKDLKKNNPACIDAACGMGHARRTGIGLEEANCKTSKLPALLHDIGKVNPDAILESRRVLIRKNTH